MGQLTTEQIAIRDMTRDFVRKEILPFAAEWDRTATVPVDTVLRIGALGLFGVCVPAEWGGSGADFTSYVLATDELAYGDAGVCNMVSATNSFCFKVRDFGTPDQKERFLRPVASGRAIACMLLTEPQAGSDAANQRTRAVRKGDRWVLHGTKSLITSGRSARVAVILAVTDPGAGKRGISAFLTPTDRPGYRVIRVEQKLGHRTNDTCQIVLEDLEVPAENLLGQPGEGLRIAFSGLDSGRIGVAAQSLGVARAAFDAALAYARERETFGKKLIEHQAVAFQLADMATDIAAARELCLHAAALKQSRVRCIKEASMSKLFASRMCERVCSAAIQIHGGYGFVADYPVEKLYRDARVFQIYDGTNEVQKILISRELAAGH
jgi:alkylation response protein AidB-like acyl-CoA dehydrogenase